MSDSQCTKIHEVLQASLILNLAALSDADLFAGIRALMAEAEANMLAAWADMLDTLARER